MTKKLLTPFFLALFLTLAGADTCNESTSPEETAKTHKEESNKLVEEAKGPDDEGESNLSILTKYQSAHMAACDDASDCTFVSDCCGCNRGGRRILVNKKYASAMASKLKKLCGNSACILVISQHPSCQNDAQALCQNQKCTLK